MKKALKGILFILLYLILLVFSQIGIAFAALWMARKQIAVGLDLNRPEDVAILREDLSSWLVSHNAVLMLIADFILIGALLLILKLRHISPKQRFGRGKLGIENFLGVVFLLIGTSIGTGIILALPALQPYMASHDQAMETISMGNPLLVLLAVGILAPIVEEVTFRGMIYREMRTFCPVFVSAIMSAALFGLVHMNVVQSTYAGFLGLVFALAYEKTDTIKVPILLHIAFNTVNLTPDISLASPPWLILLVGIISLGLGAKLLHKKY